MEQMKWPALSIGVSQDIVMMFRISSEGPDAFKIQSALVASLCKENVLSLLGGGGDEGALPTDVRRHTGLV